MPRNVELLRRWYETWNSQGLETFEIFREHLDPAMEFREPSEFPGSGTFRGVEEWRASMSRLFEAWEQIVFEPEEFLESGDKVFATVRVRTVGRATGIETERVIFHVLTIRHERVVHWQLFFERAAALRELRLKADGAA
jgi:ketosteroid isomerase-like protein